MTGYTEIEDLAAAHRLAVFGGFHLAPEDGLPGFGTLLMFGPAEPGFWAHMTAQPEWRDGLPDPIDRWSKRILGGIARTSGGRAIHPSDGPPYPPFFRWALRTGRAWSSPVTLLVHDQAGLMLSYRGAVAVPGRVDLPMPPGTSPCKTCADQPCRTACPAGALTAGGYDLATCHDYLDSGPGSACLSSGCAVRRACPISRAYGRLAEQSEYHMRQFHT